MGSKARIMTARIMAAFAIIGTLASATAGESKADDDRKSIDCTETDLHFTGDGFKVTCSELKSQQLQQSDGSAQIRVEMLTASTTDDRNWLIALDFRILGSLAIRRMGLEDDVHSHFTTLPTKNWKSTDDVGGFEAAEFESVNESRDIYDCVAFQQFMNRRYNGFSRWVVGVSCSTKGVETARQTLTGFGGPGG